MAPLSTDLTPSSSFYNLRSLILAVIVITLSLFSIVAVASTRIMRFQFKLLLMNICLAQMLQWVMLIMLFVWYPAFVKDGTLIREQVNFVGVCTKLLSLLEACGLLVVGSIGFFSVMLFISLVKHTTTTNSILQITIGITMLWGDFVLNLALLTYNRFGAAHDYGFCSANSEVPNYWFYQSIMLAQLVASMCVLIGFNFLVVIKKKSYQDYPEIKILVRVVLYLSVMVGLTLLTNFVPGFSPFTFDTTTSVMTHQIFAILATVPTLTTPVLMICICCEIEKKFKMLRSTKSYH